MFSASSYMLIDFGRLDGFYVTILLIVKCHEWVFHFRTIIDFQREWLNAF